MRKWLAGPDPRWRRDSGRDDTTPAGLPEELSPEALDRQRHLQELDKEPEMARLQGSPPRLQAYCRARLLEARMAQQALTLEDVLRDAGELGDEELSEMASSLCHAADEPKAGSSPQVRVLPLRQAEDNPGEEGVPQGEVQIGELVWVRHDYGDEVEVPEELQEAAQWPSAQPEPRQCLLLNTAAAYLWATTGRQPTRAEAGELASRWRWEGWAQAKEAEVALGTAPPWVAPTEHDLRVFIHDVVEFGHDKDFRTFAGLPIHDLRAAAVFVLRVNGWGRPSLRWSQDRPTTR